MSVCEGEGETGEKTVQHGTTFSALVFHIIGIVQKSTKKNSSNNSDAF